MKVIVASSPRTRALSDVEQRRIVREVVNSPFIFHEKAATVPNTKQIENFAEKNIISKPKAKGKAKGNAEWRIY